MYVTFVEQRKFIFLRSFRILETSLATFVGYVVGTEQLAKPKTYRMFLLMAKIASHYSLNSLRRVHQTFFVLLLVLFTVSRHYVI